jgi:ribosomal 30S subunit maturation factor RimM
MVIGSLNAQDEKIKVPPREWIDLVGKTVRTSDKQDLGDIEYVGNEVIVVKRILLSFVHLHYYYIPFVEVQGWDDKVALLKISRDQVEKQYSSHDPPKRAEDNAKVGCVVI